MAAALGEFAHWDDTEDGKLLVVLVYNAGWRVVNRLEVPSNVLPHRLSSRAPDS